MKTDITPPSWAVTLLAGGLLLSSAGLSAQSPEQPQVHEHHDMDHSQMQHSDMAPTATEHSDMAHSGTEHDAMTHSEMQMQGGDAPADARDPHAYSNGYTLTEGPYAMADSRYLKHAVEHRLWSFMADTFERDVDNDATSVELQASYGSSFERVVVKTEGHSRNGKVQESQSELLWRQAFSAYWDAQFGVRYDQFAEGDNRQWLAFGVQGLAPYWFEIDLSAYIGSHGRSALNFAAEYELLLTQRLIMQVSVEASAYGKDDPLNGIGKGLAAVNTGLRLRYEFSRQLAPYIGLERQRKFGRSADFADTHAEPVASTSLVAGIRFWF